MHEETLAERRNRAMGPAYHLFYREPVHLVRGEGVWLYDASGRKHREWYFFSDGNVLENDAAWDEAT